MAKIVNFFLILSVYSSFRFCDGSLICKSSACEKSADYLLTIMNSEVPPCKNFYEFVCGNWNQYHNLHREDVHGNELNNVEEILQNENEINILKYLAQENKPKEPEPLHKARTLFFMCQDEGEKYDFREIGEILRTIGLTKYPPLVEENPEFQLFDATVNILKYFKVQVFFKLVIKPDLRRGGSINRLFLEALDPESHPFARYFPIYNNINKNEEDYLKSLFTEYIKFSCAQAPDYNTTKVEDTEDARFNFCSSLSPESKTYDATMRIANFMSYRKSFQENLLARPKERPIYKEVTVGQLDSISNSIAKDLGRDGKVLSLKRMLYNLYKDWNYRTLGVLNIDHIPVLVDESYFKKALNFIYEHHDNTHELGLWWMVTNRLAPFVNSKFASSVFIPPFSNRTNSTSNIPKNVWCAGIVAEVFEYAVKYYYTTLQNYGPQKIRIYKMAENIRSIIERELSGDNKLEECYKRAAREAIQSIKFRIGMPDPIRTKRDLNKYYENVKILPGVFSTVLDSIKNSVEEEYMRYNSEYDGALIRSDRRPNQIFALYYDRSIDIVQIPFSMVQFPIFRHGAASGEYGAIGYRIASQILESIFYIRPQFENEAESNICQINIRTMFRQYLQYGKPSQKFNMAFLAYQNYVKALKRELIPSQYPMYQGLDRLQKYNNNKLFSIFFAGSWCNSNKKSFIVDEASNVSKPFKSIWRCPK